jgi:hypothetical protein
MSACETEDCTRRGARRRKLKTAAIGKLERRAWAGTAADYVPLISYGDRFREGHRHRPAAQCGGAGIGDIHLDLEVRVVNKD